MSPLVPHTRLGDLAGEYDQAPLRRPVSQRGCTSILHIGVVAIRCPFEVVRNERYGASFRCPPHGDNPVHSTGRFYSAWVDVLFLELFRGRKPPEPVTPAILSLPDEDLSVRFCVGQETGWLRLIAIERASYWVPPSALTGTARRRPLDVDAGDAVMLPISEAADVVGDRRQPLSATPHHPRAEIVTTKADRIVGFIIHEASRFMPDDV